MDMHKYDNLITLREFIKTKPELFPLNADEIYDLENKRDFAPETLSESEWLLLMVAEHMNATWAQFDERDPENGEQEYYDYIYKGVRNFHE